MAGAQCVRLGISVNLDSILVHVHSDSTCLLLRNLTENWPGGPRNGNLRIGFVQRGTSPMIPAQHFIFEHIYQCKDCPRGHKCLFAAAQPVPCPFKQYNSHFNQTTCQDCDQYFGEHCPEGSGKFSKCHREQYRCWRNFCSLALGYSHVGESISDFMMLVTESFCWWFFSQNRSPVC